MAKKTEKIGGINFILDGAPKTRKAFDKLYGGSDSFHKLNPTKLDKVWDTLQEVLIAEGYKKKPKKKSKKDDV